MKGVGLQKTSVPNCSYMIDMAAFVKRTVLAMTTFLHEDNMTTTTKPNIMLDDLLRRILKDQKHRGITGIFLEI